MPRTTSKRPMTQAEYMAKNRSLLASGDTRSPLAKAVNWTPDKSELVRGLLSGANDVVGRGTIASLLGLPADLGGLLHDSGAAVNNKIKEWEVALGLVKPEQARWVQPNSGVPYLGSEHIGQKMESAGLVSAERRPKTELAASLLSPSAVAKTVINAPKTAKTLLQMADNLSARPTMARIGQRGAIDVWHGSGSEYDKFAAMKRVGLGQGGQSFGVGGYHASDVNVGKEYVPDGGYLYQNRLRWPNATKESADPLSGEHFLDWDKPFDEQSDYVKSAISSLDEDEWYRVLDNLGEEGDWSTGRNIYDMARLQFDSREEASRKLYEAGIPGIRFNDADTIHRLGTNTPNYVTFGDDLVEILTRNGKPVK